MLPLYFAQFADRLKDPWAQTAAESSTTHCAAPHEYTCKIPHAPFREDAKPAWRSSTAPALAVISPLPRALVQGTTHSTSLSATPPQARCCVPRRICLRCFTRLALSLCSTPPMIAGINIHKQVAAHGLREAVRNHDSGVNPPNQVGRVSWLLLERPAFVQEEFSLASPEDAAEATRA